MNTDAFTTAQQRLAPSDRDVADVLMRAGWSPGKAVRWLHAHDARVRAEALALHADLTAAKESRA